MGSIGSKYLSFLASIAKFMKRGFDITVVWIIELDKIPQGVQI
jgi:hypothetical protein